MENRRENGYALSQIAQFTGLSDRTIRNYITAGILRGEKKDGRWYFSPEQVDDFVSHPAVRPSILAKNNGIVYDFLLDNKKTKQEICIILDVLCADKERLSDYFCDSINQGEFESIRFSFDGVMEHTRVILSGNAQEVLCLVNAYYDQYSVAEEAKK